MSLKLLIPSFGFETDKLVTRAEMVKGLVNMYGLEPAASTKKGSTRFNDVSADHWASGYINVADDYRFLIETADMDFRPDEAITCSEAVTMCLRVLGYTNVVESRGTWPTNYIAKAQDLELFKNFEFRSSYDDELTRGNFALLIWNTLNTKMWIITGRSEEGVYIEPSNTMLEIMFPEKVDKIKELTQFKKLEFEEPVINLEDGDRVRLGCGNKVDFKLLVEPSYATEEITFTTSNKFDVKVWDSGANYAEITARAPGVTAIITAKSASGKTATCKVIVKAEEVENVNVTSLKLSKSECTFCLSENTKFNIPTIFNPTIEPANATNKTITWSSSDPSIVSIVDNKYVITKAKGEAVLTAKTADGVTATCKLKVVDHDLSITVGYNDDTHWEYHTCKNCNEDIGKKNVESHTFVDGVCKCGKTSPKTSEEIVGTKKIKIEGKKNYTLEVGEEIDVKAEIISTFEDDDGSNDKLAWKSSNSNIVEVKGNNRKAKLIAKGSGSCKITVSFEEIKATIKVEVVEPEVTIEYDDVKEEDWYEESVKYVTTNNLMNGVGENKFSPSSDMTRGMLVTVLYRMSESKYSGKASYVDVGETEYYSSAVAWATKNGIVNGIGDNKFAPNAEVTREQLIVILYRYAKVMKADVSAGESTNILSYDDFNEVAEYSVLAFQWGCGEKIISGRTKTTLSPKGTASRAEVATMLMRFSEKYGKSK